MSKAFGNCIFLFLFPVLFVLIVQAEASWNTLAGTWTDQGATWEGILPRANVWHYGPARLWSVPVNSGSYVITSRAYIRDGNGCGHVFKYKKGSVRTRTHVTKAWGYFLWSRGEMYISSSGGQGDPRIGFSFSSGKWYTQKSVVDGTNVKIYVDDKLVKEITMSGEGADSKTGNYVGLWCHGTTHTGGDSFKISRVYFMADPAQNCYDNCKQQGMGCVEKGGFPGGKSTEIFARLGSPCSTGQPYTYTDNPCIAPGNKHCYGMTKIPDKIFCGHGHNPAVRRLCPCTSSATCPRLSLSGSVTVLPSNCTQSDSPIGAMCSFSCARGYRLIGPPSINCTGNDAWTDQSANVTCEAATCPQLSIFGSVTVSPSRCSQSDSPVGAMCSFSCARGYRLIGPPSINCTGNGAWTDQSANVTCEDINECLTDNGGCSHSCTNTPGAYRCTCPDPELGLDANNHTCKADGVTVNCGKGDMSITLPKSLLRGLDRHHLRLLNTSCQATETASHYTLETPLTGCGTTSRHTNAAVVYSNKVVEMPVSKKDIITRVREIEIPFHCYYGNDGVVSAVGFKPSNKKLVFLENGQGNFSLSLDIFPDKRFVVSYKNADFPVDVVLRQRLYFQVSVSSADKRLSIMADRCFATPTQDSNGPTKYVLISGGCSKDDTLKFHSPPSTNKQRFSVEAFKFIADHSLVFVHCHVKICNATDPNSGCVRRCPSRGKRAADHMLRDEKPLYSLSEGPFFLNQEDSEDEPAFNLVSNGSSTALLLVALCVICLAGVAIMVRTMKLRKKNEGYTLLHE